MFVRKTFRRFLLVAAIAVPGISLSHWFTAIPLVNPTTTVVAVGTPTTTTSAPATSTGLGTSQWYCTVKATGATVNGPHATQALAKAACSTPTLSDGVTRQLVERVRATVITSTTSTTTRLEDRTTPRFDIVGGPSIEITPAQAQIVLVSSGGGGTGGVVDGGDEQNPLTSNYTLEVTYPKEIAASPNGLDADNRAFFAAQGVAYSIPLAAVGGMPPFSWSGTSLPTGATVESYASQSGQLLWRLSWPNPQTDASNVVVTVTDVHGATDSETFSIDVQADGAASKFRYVDAVNGSNASNGQTPGTAWQTLGKVWSDGLKDKIIYFDTGVYDTTGITLAGGTVSANFDSDGNGGLGRPTQWLAYPGQSPEIDLGAMGGDTPFYKLAEAEAAYVEGFELYGDWTKTFEVQMDEGRGAVFWNNTFHTGGDGADGSNSAFIMTTSVVTAQQYGMVIANNSFGAAGHNALKLYTLSKPVIEGNLFDDNDGIATKDSIQLYTVQLNKAQNINASAALVTGNHNGAVQTTYGEVRFNLVLSTGGDAIDWVQGHIASVGALSSYRNTLIGTISIDTLSASDGIRSFTRDVIINATAASGSCPAKFTCTSVTDFTKLTTTDNLTGVAADGITDVNGLLTGASRTSYGPGTSTRRGHEIG